MTTIDEKITVLQEINENIKRFRRNNLEDVELFATQAELHAISAAEQSAIAISAKNDAEMARDVAMLASNIYDNTQAGLSSTVSGEYFSTPGTISDQFLILYKNDNGVAVEQNTYISSVGVINEINKKSAVADKYLQTPWLESCVVFGDSRAWNGQLKWKNATISDKKGLDLGSGFIGPGQADGTTGTLEYEYRSGDYHLRWTANGDAAGEWYPMHAGIMQLDSGTPGPEFRLELPVKSISTSPVTDQTLSVLASGALYLGNRPEGVIERAMNILRWPMSRLHNASIGGNSTSTAIEQLPILRWRGVGPGFAIVILGTNDISSSVDVNTIKSNLNAIYDRLASQGLRLIIVGEHARWGASVGVPLESGQIALFDEVVAFQKSYAHLNGHLFVDTYAVTYDGAHSDRRPLPDILSDTVHPGPLGAQIIGSAIANTISGWIGKGRQIDSSYPNNLQLGYFSGDGGTISTGATGSAPNGWFIRRVTGSSATVASSLVARTDGISGNWWLMQPSSAESGQVIEGSLLSANQTLTNLNLEVGDEVQVSVEYKFENLTNIGGCRTFIILSGLSPARTIMLSFEDANSKLQDGSGIFKSPRFTIPASCTGLRAFIYIYCNAGADGDLYFANFRYEKINII